MQNKYIKLLIISLAVVIIVPQIAFASWWNPMSWGWLNSIFHFQQTEQKTACTMEAKLCPDGSSVGRQGPKCEFAACPTDQTAGWKTYINTEYGFEIKYPSTINVAMENYTPVHGTNLVLPNDNFLEKVGLVGNILSFGIFQKPNSNLEEYVSNDVLNNNKFHAKYNESPDNYKKININGIEAFDEGLGQSRRTYIENSTHVFYFQYVGSDKIAQQIVSTFKFIDQNSLQNGTTGANGVCGKCGNDCIFNAQSASCSKPTENFFCKIINGNCVKDQ